MLSDGLKKKLKYFLYYICYLKVNVLMFKLFTYYKQKLIKLIQTCCFISFQLDLVPYIALAHRQPHHVYFLTNFEPLWTHTFDYNHA